MRHSPSRPRFLSGVAVIAATAAMLLIPAHQATAKAEPGCAAGGVKIKAGASPATVSLNDTTTSTPVQVVVTITGTTFAITPVDSSVTLTSATWCLKASTQTQNGTGTTGTSTITNKKGVAQKIGDLVVYEVTSSNFVDPVGSCFDNADSSLADVWYSGPINTLNNLTARNSTNGTCTGEPFRVFTIVRANDTAGANAWCNSLTGAPAETTLIAIGYSAAPADFWLCRFVTAPPE